MTDRDGPGSGPRLETMNDGMGNNLDDRDQEHVL